MIKAPLGNILIPVSFKKAVLGLIPVAIITKSQGYAPLLVITSETFPLTSLNSIADSLK